MTLVETRRVVEPEIVKRLRARVDTRVQELVDEALERRDAEHRAEREALSARLDYLEARKEDSAEV
jgi:hypothetical protein